jgi:AcrR family transcriptional regulator
VCIVVVGAGENHIVSSVIETVLSPKQREIREREELILQVARGMFFEQGYYGLTMAKIAKRVGCAKGTVYLHFPCKEDLIVAIAQRCHARRQAMLERAGRFRGRSRERVVALACAGELYTRLYPGDMQIFHTLTPSLRQKVDRVREEEFEAMERFTMRALVSVIQRGIDAGDLVPPPGVGAGELTLGLWAVADGGYRVVLSGVDLAEMGVTRPYVSIMRYIHLLADSYGWRPLSTEWDYDETLRRVHLQIFPEETQRLFEVGEPGMTRWRWHA